MKYLFLFLIIVLFVSACGTSKFDCKDWTDSFRDNYRFNLIVDKIEKNSVVIYFYGRNPSTGKKDLVMEGSGWTSAILDTFKVGDTLIKKRDEYKITIKRKNAILSIPMVCERVIYKDSLAAQK